MRIAIGSDHAGFALKGWLAAHLRELGHLVIDIGMHGTGSADYVDFAEAVGGAVVDGRAERGLLITGTGVGASVAANKLSGVRAALCHDACSTREGVEQDGMNVLVLGAHVIGSGLARDLAVSFAEAVCSCEEHYRRRADKIDALEACWSAGTVGPQVRWPAVAATTQAGMPYGVIAVPQSRVA